MFLNKVFHFLKGYVILSLMGFNIERFLYICARRGIAMWDIKKYGKDSASVSMSMSDFFKIRQIAVKTRVRVHIKKKTGLPVLFKKYKKRYFLYGGCVLFAVSLLVTSQFIWTVEITGVKKADIESIRQVLEESGVRVGGLKYSLTSSMDIKNMMLNRVDNVAWAWVYIKGTKAVCEIYEDNLPQAALEEGVPCDIVAARDGIIRKIIARDGIKQVKSGDTVMSGDVLISGTIYNSTGGVGVTVPASGVVEAHTWHEITDTYKLYHETKVPTGEVKTFWRLNFFSKKANLYFDGHIDFENSLSEVKNYEARLGKDIFLGVSLECEKIFEVELICEPISYDMAVYNGQCDLEKRIAGELLPGAELIKEDVFHRQLDDETVEVTVRMEFIEKIGRKAKIYEE